jgi:hypothetical protein
MAIKAKPKATKKYDILSPDGIPIDYEAVYDSPAQAEAAFKEWAKRYKHQGYYSSTKGRISLRSLRKYCTLKIITS